MTFSIIFSWHRSTAWKVSVFEVFLVRIFAHSDWIWRDTPYLSTFSTNRGKYKLRKLRIKTLFKQYPGLFKISNFWYITIISTIIYFSDMPRRFQNSAKHFWWSFFDFFVMLCYVMFSLFWFGVTQLYTWKYSLIIAKLQLQNNNPNIHIKNKNDLKQFCY